MKKNKFLDPLSPSSNIGKGEPSVKRISGLGLSLDSPKGLYSVKNSRRYTSARNRKQSPNKNISASSETIIQTILQQK